MLQSATDSESPGPSNAQGTVIPNVSPVVPAPKRPPTFILTCPTCKHSKEARHTRLYHHTNKPCIIHCKHCHKASTSRKWQCECDLPWYSCAIHHPIGFACRPRDKLAPKPRHVLQITGSTEFSDSPCTCHKRARTVDHIRPVGIIDCTAIVYVASIGDSILALAVAATLLFFITLLKESPWPCPANPSLREGRCFLSQALG